MYYRELNVWQKSMDLTVEIYKLAKKLPKEETYGISDQMRRAVVSIPSNIAEGEQRNSDKEFIHFLYIARGSLAELETQLLLCARLQYLSEEEVNRMLAQCADISRMLIGLIGKISERVKGSKK